jgi:hypothetical protein
MGLCSVGGKKSSSGMVCEGQATTSALPLTEKRAAYLQQRQADRHSWIAKHPTVGLWTLVREQSSSTVWCRCQCGVEKEVRLSELKQGKSTACRSCSGKRRMQREMASDPHIATHLYCISHLATPANKQRAKYVTNDEKQLRAVVSSMRGRCVCATSRGWKNYGGRGIEFRFGTVEEAVRWITTNLGPRPSQQHSIDRIDNNKHYEPGNLRWATRQQQGQNKRSYARKEIGERIRQLQARNVPFVYETLRTFIKKGLSDADIINKRKTTSGRPRTRL